MLKIKKGDQVKILQGKDKGKTGSVEKVLAKDGRLIISGINLYKKHQKAGIGKKAQIMEIVKPVSASGVLLICPKCQNLTRLGFRLTTSGKFRVCKKCGEQI